MLSAALLSVVALGYVDRGILKLDNTTFDRIIDGNRNVFVRFDKEYSYGDEHDAWKDYAKTVGESGADLLSVDVGISEYGDKDNSDLGERFGVSTEDFPQFLLFTKGIAASGEPIKYEGEKKKEAFLRFVQEKAGAWIGLPGQVKELDELAKEFVKSSKKDAVLKKAEKAAGAMSATDADSAKYYLKVMTKASADAEFVSKETTRLQKMIDDGSVKPASRNCPKETARKLICPAFAHALGLDTLAPAKKEQFGRRLNMLTSFS